jgi:hypothetical protein
MIPFVDFQATALAGPPAPQKLAKITRNTEHGSMVVAGWTLARPSEIDSPPRLIEATVDGKNNRAQSKDQARNSDSYQRGVHEVLYVMSSVS